MLAGKTPPKRVEDVDLDLKKQQVAKAILTTKFLSKSYYMLCGITERVCEHNLDGFTKRVEEDENIKEILAELSVNWQDYIDLDALAPEYKLLLFTSLIVGDVYMLNSLNLDKNGLKNIDKSKHEGL